MEKQLKESTVSIELVQPRLLELTAPLDVSSTINRVNGVQIIDGQANIRSGSGWSYGAGSRVQVLVNGLPMLSGDAGQALWSYIPTEGVDRIEIIKGAASVVYGSSSLNGVINIQTKTSSLYPFTTVSFSTGFYNLPKRESLDYGQGNPFLSNVSAFHVSKIEGLDFCLGINVLSDAGYKMNDYDNRARTSIGVRKAWSEKNLIIGMNSSVQRGRSASFLLWDSYENGYVSLDEGLTETNSWRINIDPYLLWYHRKFKHEFKTRYLRVGNSVDNGDSTVNQSNFSDLIYSEYQMSYAMEDLKVVGGLVNQASQTKSPLFNGVQNTNNVAGYAQLERKLFSEKVLVMVGLRYEWFRLNSRSEAKPVFRAGLNYRMAKFTFIRFSMGEGYRFPSVAETYVSTKVGPVHIYPNVDLMSETGSNIEIGLKQGYKLGTLLGFVDLAVFDMKYQNMTEFIFAQWYAPTSLSDLGIGFRAVNTGGTRISGFEISNVISGRWKKVQIDGFVGYNFVVPKALSPTQSYGVNFQGDTLNFLNTSYNSSDGFLKYRPQHSLKGDFMLEIGRLHIGAGLSLQSGFKNFDTAFVGEVIPLFVPGMDTATQKELTAYTLFNARIGYRLFGHLRINLIISNILNSEYMIRPADLGAPRTLRLQISYTFK
jgi:iron complex outermembrane receptor protein